VAPGDDEPQERIRHGIVDGPVEVHREHVAFEVMDADER
jgi:hypothetical protein